MAGLTWVSAQTLLIIHFLWANFSLHSIFVHSQYPTLHSLCASVKLPVNSLVFTVQDEYEKSYFIQATYDLNNLIKAELKYIF